MSRRQTRRTYRMKYLMFYGQRIELDDDGFIKNDKKDKKEHLHMTQNRPEPSNQIQSSSTNPSILSSKESGSSASSDDNQNDSFSHESLSSEESELFLQDGEYDFLNETALDFLIDENAI